MKTKKCHACGQTLSVSNFYNNKSRYDGLHSECKECHKAWRKSHYRNHTAETMASNDRWRALHPATVRAYKCKTAKRKRDRLSELGIYGIYQKVARAIKAGILEPEPCKICGAIDVQAHHEDYSKPLDVIWFCRKHHAEHHKNVGSLLPKLGVSPENKK